MSHETNESWHYIISRSFIAKDYIHLHDNILQSFKSLLATESKLYEAPNNKHKEDQMISQSQCIMHHNRPPFVPLMKANQCRIHHLINELKAI